MKIAVCPICRIVHEVVGPAALQEASEERRYDLTHCRLCETAGGLFRLLDEEAPALKADEIGYPAIVVDHGDVVGAPQENPQHLSKRP